MTEVINVNIEIIRLIGVYYRVNVLDWRDIGDHPSVFLNDTPSTCGNQKCFFFLFPAGNTRLPIGRVNKV